MFVVISMMFAASMPLAAAGKPITPPSPNQFTVSTIDSRDDVGAYSQMALDSNNQPHIIFYDATIYALKYATNAGGSWKVQIIDTIGFKTNGIMGGIGDIAIDSQDNVYIIYSDLNHHLKYADNAGGSWMIQPLDNLGYTVNGHLSMAIDKNDNVHFCYYDVTDQNNPGIKYVNNIGGAWHYKLVDNQPGLFWTVSLALDSFNGAHITYTSLSDYKLRYATSNDGWVLHVLDPGVLVGPQASIAIDGNNHVHISYFAIQGTTYDLNKQLLSYANNVNGAWTFKTLDSTPDLYNRHWVSIAIDSLGIVHISYSYKLNLMYATNGNGGWSTKVVDGSVNYYCDISADSQNQVHISYQYGAKNSDLRYAISA